MDTILTTILYLAVIIAVGFAAQITKFVPNVKESVSRLLTHICIPCLLITTISSFEVTWDLAKEIGTVMAFALASVLVLMGIGFLTAKVCRLAPDEKGVHICLSAFGNVVFLAYPVITAVFGEKGLLLAAFYGLVNDSLFYTLGVFMISGKKSAKSILNPITLSVFAAIFMLCFGLRLPAVIGEPLAALGKVTTPLAMLFIGASLAKTNLLSILKKYYIFILSAIKLVIFPVLLLLFMELLNRAFGFGIPSLVKGVIILQVAMPAQSITAVLAETYGGDSVYATQCIFVTTLLSLVTLPLVYYILGFFP